jgi:exodeoxyribonuclease VII large subunit
MTAAPTTTAHQQTVDSWSVGDVLEAARDRVTSLEHLEGWALGVVRRLRRSRGHLFFDLEELEAASGRPALSVPVAVLGHSAERVLAGLAAAEVELADGLAVRVWGRLELYVPRARVQLVATAVHPAATLGAAVEARRRLLRTLKAEHLLEANRRCLPVPLPLRVGIVAPPGDGRGDVIAALEASGFAWRLSCATVTARGPLAASAVAWAVGASWRAGVEVVVVVGFDEWPSVLDDERVARAVARCPRPVWVAGGGSGDASVAHACAQRSFRSASAAADALVAVAGSVDAGVTEAAAAICNNARRLLASRAETVEAALSAVGTLADDAVAGRAADLDALAAAFPGLGPAPAASPRSRVAVAATGFVAVALVAVVAWLLLNGAAR